MTTLSLACLLAVAGCYDPGELPGGEVPFTPANNPTAAEPAASPSQDAEPSSFDKAATIEPITGAPKTLGGKDIAKVREQVRAMWDSIVFEKDGKKVEHQLTLKTEKGDIVLEFFPGVAPNHVRNIIALAKAGYYDGTVFHRVIPNFMIQGGCPYGQGNGGPGYALKNEFNSIKHERGTLSAARSQSPDSAGSQFFICDARSPHLDNQYTAYGHVVKGLDVVDEIVQSPVTDRRSGTVVPGQQVKLLKATVTEKKAAE